MQPRSFFRKSFGFTLEFLPFLSHYILWTTYCISPGVCYPVLCPEKGSIFSLSARETSAEES